MRQPSRVILRWWPTWWSKWTPMSMPEMWWVGTRMHLYYGGLYCTVLGLHYCVVGNAYRHSYTAYTSTLHRGHNHIQKSQSPVQCTVKPPDEATTAECIVLIVYIYVHISVWLQNQMTPVHSAAHLGHVEVLRIFINGYHADKMVKAMVSVPSVLYAITAYTCKCCTYLLVLIGPAYSSASARMVGCPSTMLLMVVTLRQWEL